MFRKELTLMIIAFFLAGAFTACTGSDKSGSNTLSPAESYSAAEAALEKQGVQLISDDTETHIRFRITMESFISQYDGLKTTDDKVTHTEATITAMESFIDKSNTFLKETELSPNDHNRVVLKRNLVSKKLPMVREIHDHLAVIQIEEALDEHTLKEKPYFIRKPFNEEEKVHLCGPVKDLDDLRRNYYESHYAFLRILLCTDERIFAQAKQVFAPFFDEGAVLDFRLPFVASKSGPIRTVELPKNSELLKNTTLDFAPLMIRLEDGESLPRDEDADGYLAPILHMPLLEFLYLIENDDMTKHDVALYVSFFLRGRSWKSLPLLAHFGEISPQRQAILEKFKSPYIRDLLVNLFREATYRSTDEIIQYVVLKDYDSLKLYATSRNTNQTSINKRDLVVDDEDDSKDIYHFGLSPLMAAALLNDQRSIDILLAVEGIDPNLESPIFKTSYTGIRSSSRGALRDLQFYGGGGSGFGSGGSGGSGSSGSSSSGGSSRSARGRNFRSGYTSLMMAVSDNNCEAVSTLAKNEPSTVNHVASYARTALSISLDSDDNNCLKELLEAGAYTLNYFTDSVYRSLLMRTAEKNPNIDVDDFVKHIPTAELNKPETKTLLQESLIYGGLSIDLKKALQERLPVSKDQLISALSSQHTRGSHCREELASFSRCFDLNFAHFMKIDLATLAVFGDQNETIFNYYINSLPKSDEGLPSTWPLERLISQLSDINPKWVTDWANKADSLKGQSPLVAASMFGYNSLVVELLEVEGIDPTIIDKKTGFNALEWQYISSNRLFGLRRSEAETKLRSMGVELRQPRVIEVPKIEARFRYGLKDADAQAMEQFLKDIEDPFL